MAFFDFLSRKPVAAVEYVHAVPVLARKFTTTGAVPKETYLFYAFLFEKSAELAVVRLRKELRDEGFEFLEIAGQTETVPLTGWSAFVAKRLDWIKDSLPTTEQLRDGARGIIYYSPKIVRA